MTNGLVLLAGAMLAPIYALFVRDIGGDLLDASYTVGIFALAAGVTTLLAGRYADNVKNSELIIVVGYLIMGAGFFLFIFVKSLTSLLLVQALIGFSEALYAPSFDALFSKYLKRHKEGKAWGTWESLNYFSVAIGALIGGFIVTFFNFSILFVVMSLLCVFSGAYIFLLPRRAL